MHLSLNARKRNYQRLNFAAAAASLSRAMLKGNRRENQGSNEEPVEGRTRGEKLDSSSALLKMEQCLWCSVRYKVYSLRIKYEI